MHQDPQVYNYAPKGAGADRSWRRDSRSPSSRWSTSGRALTRVLDDQWTVVTADGSASAHFEHTFTLTEEGPWVLTALDGGKERLQELGALRPSA